MKGFKKVTYDLMEGENMIGGFATDDISLEEAIKILTCKGVIKATFTRYSQKQAFDLGAEKVWKN